jgi:hypothetical protein
LFVLGRWRFSYHCSIILNKEGGEEEEEEEAVED